jgi:hypothetical protein
MHSNLLPINSQLYMVRNGVVILSGKKGLGRNHSVIFLRNRDAPGYIYQFLV